MKAKTPTVTLLASQTDLQLLIDALREHDTRRADELANSFQKSMAAVGSSALLGRTVEWEIVLSGEHPDICVIVSAPENATDAELQSLAETEAMAKTYIWSKKRVRPNAKRSGGQKTTDA